MQTLINTNSKIKFTDTYVIGMMIQGCEGEVEVVKQNRKSFRYEGRVHCHNNGSKVFVEGKAKFWKESSDGRLLFKDGTKVLTVEE